MKNKHLTLFFSVFCITVLITSPLYAQLDKDFVSKSVMKVIVEYENGEEESATGFLWRDNLTLVTSYHVVQAGYKSITIQDVYGWKASAEVSKIYKPADLMILKITSDPNEGWKPFKLTNNDVKEGEKTKAYGYNNTASGIVPISLEKTDPIPGGTLYYAIPEEDRDALKALGFPSLKLPIMYLLGSLLPGYSGSPIVNQKGELVAIGDGGLNKGTTNSSWGIPVENLSKLASVNGGLASRSSSRLFSSGGKRDDNRINKDEYKLEGGYDFFYTRTVKLKDIVAASDNPELVNAYLLVFEDFGFDLENLEFEVYQEVTSNYVFVVPKGAEIEHKGNYLNLYAYDKNLYATFTPNGVVKNSLQEFTDWWLSVNESDEVSFTPVSDEELQTTSDGFMRMASFLEFEQAGNQASKLWELKGIKVHDNQAFIQSRVWLKDIDINDFLDCYGAESGAACTAEAKERVRIEVISKLMMQLMTIANTKVLHIDPLRDFYWEAQDLNLSFPDTLKMEPVSQTELAADIDDFSMSLHAEETSFANDYNTLIDYLEGWTGNLPDWQVMEYSVPDEVQTINGFNAVFGFYKTGNDRYHGLLFTAYRPEDPYTRYDWIVIFTDDKLDTVDEMIRRFGKR